MPYDARQHRFANNAWGKLASAIGSGDLSMNVTLGSGAAWPSIAVGEIFKATIFDTSSGNREIVNVTAVSGITLTIERGKEGTAAQAFAAGVVVQHGVTAETLEWFEAQA